MLKARQVPKREVEIFDYSRDNGIIGWMDCGGSNLVKINDQLGGIVRIVATTRPDGRQGCKAKQRAGEFDVPYAFFDIAAFEESRGVYPGDYFKALRYVELDNMLKEVEPRSKEGQILYLQKRVWERKIKSRMQPGGIITTRDTACKRFMDEIYDKMEEAGLTEDLPMFAAGGMALLSKQFVENFFILNVHPGDVTKHSLEGTLRGERMIVGDGWIPPARAISAGHETLYSSMHGMIYEMDAGPNYMRGYGLPIDYNYIMSRVDIRDKETLKLLGEAAQEVLKHIGDHVIAGATFMDVFDKRWGMHTSGVQAYKRGNYWHLQPNGIMIQDHVANHESTPFARSDDFVEKQVAKFYREVDNIARLRGR